MSSLAALVVGYVVAVVLGKRSRRIGPGLLLTLGVIVLVEVVIVVVNMFLMNPPPAGPGAR
jgi:hypothetical protein